MFYSTYVLVGGVHNNKKKLGCFTNIFYIYYRFFQSSPPSCEWTYSNSASGIDGPCNDYGSQNSVTYTPEHSRQHFNEKRNGNWRKTVYAERFLLRFGHAFSVAIWLCVFCCDLIIRFLWWFDHAFSVAIWFCIFCCVLILRFLLRFDHAFSAAIWSTIFALIPRELA